MFRAYDSNNDGYIDHKEILCLYYAQAEEDYVTLFSKVLSI